MTATRAAGREARRGQVLELGERLGLDAVLLRRPENFAWYTGGGNSRVEYVAPVGVADVVITPDEDYVLTSTIEAPRMQEEETPDLPVVEYPWHEGVDAAVRGLFADRSFGADVPLAEARDLSDEAASLRRRLDADALERLRSVGADLTAALADAATQVAPGMTEHEAAAVLAAACRRRGLVATVLLAAADGRIGRHRHPLPRGVPIERRVMLVASAQRGGLYANLTRIVDFEEPDPEVARRQAACDEILTRMREQATLPGRTLAEAFGECQRYYDEANFPGEWRLHHQGGMTGYASREVIATPYTDVLIESGQAFAWNPSVSGAKAEETFVVGEHGAEVIAGVGPAGA